MKFKKNLYKFPQFKPLKWRSVISSEMVLRGFISLKADLDLISGISERAAYISNVKTLHPNTLILEMFDRQHRLRIEGKMTMEELVEDAKKMAQNLYEERLKKQMFV